MEEENGGISFAEIFRVIFTQKWLALAIALLVTLAATFALNYGYNPSQKEYEARFTINLPGGSDGSLYRFPDGNLFYYTDIVSKENLESIKNSAMNYFGDIDVGYMTEKGKINISIDYISKKEDDPTVGYEAIYVLKAKANMFNSTDQAKRFIYEAANMPVFYISNMDIDYDVYLAVSDEAKDYDHEIQYFKNQIDLLGSYYSSLINTYGGSTMIKGQTLSAYAEKINAYLNSGVLDNLLAEARDNKYLKKEDLKATYALEISTLQRELEIQKTVLETLLKVSSDASTGSTTIVTDATAIREQTERVARLEQQISLLQSYIAEGNTNAEFDKKVKSSYDIISAFTKDYSDVSRTVYSAATSVKFENSNIITEKGGISFVLLVVLSLVVGVIIAGIVAYCVGIARIKKNMKAEGTEEEKVSEEEKTSEE